MVMRPVPFLPVLAVLWAVGPVVTAAAEPITVRDALDRAVTVPAPPQRIVTIFASNTEMVAALGLADRIVGIEAYTRYPPEVVGKPLVGGRSAFGGRDSESAAGSGRRHAGATGREPAR
jgi:iron complex transport system substrate-binding protein